MREGGQRIHCCVPFCRRTTKAHAHDPTGGEGWEWICSVHWHGIRKERRRAYSRVQKIWWGKDGRGMSLGEIMSHRKWGKRAVHRSAAERLFERIKREAIERAAGI